jgi:hypothetical protein
MRHHFSIILILNIIWPYNFLLDRRTIGCPQKRTSSKIPSEYAPGLDFKSPKSRKAISDALYDLWDYCVEEQIPLLNMLVVLPEFCTQSAVDVESVQDLSRLIVIRK